MASFDYSLSWALNFLSGTPFRTFLVIVFVITFVRFLLTHISFGQLIRITVALILIALVPQMLHFFQRLMMTH